jgi:hypothetical protein
MEWPVTCLRHITGRSATRVPAHRHDRFSVSAGCEFAPGPPFSVGRPPAPVPGGIPVARRARFVRQLEDMTSRLTECVVDCADPATLSRFWAEALGYQVLEESADLVEIGPGGQTDAELVANLRSGPAVPSLIFIRVPEPKTIKNRLHFDLSPIDTDRDSEVARLEQLGARRTNHAPADSGWIVMTDPEGNEFCVLRSLAPGHFAP